MIVAMLNRTNFKHRIFTTMNPALYHIFPFLFRTDYPNRENDPLGIPHANNHGDPNKTWVERKHSCKHNLEYETTLNLGGIPGLLPSPWEISNTNKGVHVSFLNN
jgi:hypothetical protein